MPITHNFHENIYHACSLCLNINLNILFISQAVPNLFGTYLVHFVTHINSLKYIRFGISRTAISRILPWVEEVSKSLQLLVQNIRITRSSTYRNWP